MAKENENIIKLNLPNDKKNSILENSRFSNNERIEETLKKLEDLGQEIQNNIFKNNSQSNIISFNDLKNKKRN